jgi:hypothetical protein
MMWIVANVKWLRPAAGGLTCTMLSIGNLRAMPSATALRSAFDSSQIKGGGTWASGSMSFTQPGR